MKRYLIIVLMLVLTVLSFASCGCDGCNGEDNSGECNHIWQNADCDTPKTCSVCGQTKGEAVGHSWVNADCDTPKTCSVCGQTEGEALGHSWVNADCDTPKTCSVCGQTEGAAVGHSWVNADCDTPKTCSVCGQTEGAAVGHSWVNADCDTPKTCSVCGQTEGAALGHTYNAENAEWLWAIEGEAAFAKLILVCDRSAEHKEEIEAAVEIITLTSSTCTEAGHGKYKATVDFGNKTYTDVFETELSPIEHSLDYDTAVWVWESDFSSATLEITCTLGETHKEFFLAEAEIEAQAPSCEEGGYNKFRVSVEVMGEELSDERTVDVSALGHDFILEETVWNREGTERTASLNLICQNDSNHRHTIEADVSSEITKQPTCAKSGVLHFVAFAEYNSAEFSAEADEEIAAIGHSYVEGYCVNCRKHEPTEELEYELLEDGSGYRVIGMGNASGNVLSIPDEYEGLPVLEIADNAFSGNLDVTEIYVGDNVQTVGKSAFSNCKNVRTLILGSDIKIIKNSAFYGMMLLGEAELPEGVSEIWNYAFGNCVSIISFTLPKSLTYLSESAFYDCYKLLEIKNLSESVTVSASFSNHFYLKNVYSDKEGESKLVFDKTGCVFYDGEENYLLSYRGNSASVTLPESFDGEGYSIWHYCFYDVTFGDHKLYIPVSVTAIGGYAFAYNTSIMIVEGGEGVVNIDAYAFYSCSELLSFTLGNNVRNIGTNAFNNCVRLMEVINHSYFELEVGTGVGMYVATYAYKIFTDASVKTSHITITDDGYAFYLEGGDCYLVRYIGKESDIELPKYYLTSEYDIYKRAFSEKEELRSVKLAPGIEVILEKAFWNCSSLTRIEMSDEYIRLKRIEDYAFADTALASIDIPSSLVHIGKYAFPATLAAANFQNTENWYYNRLGEGNIATAVGDKLLLASDAAEFLLEKEEYYFFVKE